MQEFAEHAAHQLTEFRDNVGAGFRGAVEHAVQAAEGMRRQVGNAATEHLHGALSAAQQNPLFAVS